MLSEDVRHSRPESSCCHSDHSRCVSAYEIGSIGVLNERISTTERDVSGDRRPLVLETSAVSDHRTSVKCKQTTKVASNKKELVAHESRRRLSATENDPKHQQVE